MAASIKSKINTKTIKTINWQWQWWWIWLLVPIIFIGAILYQIVKLRKEVEQATENFVASATSDVFVYPDNPCDDKDSYVIYDNAYHCIPKGTKHTINNNGNFCNVYSGQNRIIAQGVSNTVAAATNVLWKIGTDSSADCSSVGTLKAY